MIVAIVILSLLGVVLFYVAHDCRKKMDAANERARWAEDRKQTWEKLANESYPIINVLKKEIATLKEESTPPPFSAFRITPDWLASDVLSLRKFLATETGDKLMKRARVMEFANAVAGAQDQFHTVHSAGRTAGVTDTLNWIESCASDKMFNELSQATGEQVAKNDTSDFPQDEEALLEKLSP